MVELLELFDYVTCNSCPDPLRQLCAQLEDSQYLVPCIGNTIADVIRDLVKQEVS